MLFFIRRWQPNIQQALSGLGTWRQQLMYYMTNSTYYEILGVTKDATQAEIKSAYYERSKKLHPDRKDCSDDQEMKRRSAAFIELTAAYEVLKVPERRQSYDVLLDGYKTFADCAEQSNFDGIFAHSHSINREKPSSFAEIYYGFWKNFGVFGDCLRFIAQSLVVAVVGIGMLIGCSD